LSPHNTKQIATEANTTRVQEVIGFRLPVRTIAVVALDFVRMRSMGRLEVVIINTLGTGINV